MKRNLDAGFSAPQYIGTLLSWRRMRTGEPAYLVKKISCLYSECIFTFLKGKQNHTIGKKFDLVID